MELKSQEIALQLRQLSQQGGPLEAIRAQKAAAIAAITAGLERGVLTPKVNAAAAFPLEAAAAAHVEVIEHARGTAGKVTLTL